jgi:hypothetical protein
LKTTLANKILMGFFYARSIPLGNPKTFPSCTIGVVPIDTLSVLLYANEESK